MGNVSSSENTIGFVEAKLASPRRSPSKSDKPLGSLRLRKTFAEVKVFAKAKENLLQGEQESQFCTFLANPPSDF